MLGRRLAEHEAFEPAFANWLAQAPSESAHTFAFTHHIRRMRPDFAKQFASVLATGPEDSVDQCVAEISGLEIGREPFVPWLQKLAKRKGEIGRRAAGVLARWAKKP
jgi:hypothetical protein